MTADMTHTPAEHVAQRIRMYRTRQHMTIDTLARKLHVSPSTISKYENARLALNVSVLFEIADALNVSVNQLTDYQKPGKPKIEKTDERSFFRRSNIFYMYQYFAIDRKIYPCVMEVQTNLEQDYDDIVLYYDVADECNYTDAQYIYKGTMFVHDFITNIYCKNPYNESDDLSICAKATFSLKNTTTGLLIALSQSLRNPYAIKVIFSLNPLPMDDALRDELIISDKSTLAELKRVNSLVIY